ncbi:MAG: tRNA pseudouridine(38-40) synthase TruA [Lentisphaeria bacterium]
MELSDEQEAQPICWHFTVAYDGSAYSGWQVQTKLPTVQGEIRSRLRRMLRNPELKITGSSRTDAGVHALDQQVSFTAVMPPDIDLKLFPSRLNRWLPDDIVLKSAEIRKDDFNARFDNCGKAYTYCVSPARKINPLFARYFWRTAFPLNVERMREAAGYLQGEKDFVSFASNPHRELDSTVRNLRRLEVYEKDGMIYIVAVGDSFLYKMVRSLAGYLVHIGGGHAKPEDALRVLAGRDRGLAEQSAPARGLFLAKVFFSPDEWKTYKPELPPFAFHGMMTDANGEVLPGICRNLKETND